MVSRPEKTPRAIRFFDGADGTSTVLVQQNAGDILYSDRFSNYLRVLGYESRIVVNRDLPESTVVKEHTGKPVVDFPLKTTQWGNVLGCFMPTHMAHTGLEVKPPLDESAVLKCAGFLRKIAVSGLDDLRLYDDRGEAKLAPLCS